MSYSIDSVATKQFTDAARPVPTQQSISSVSGDGVRIKEATVVSASAAREENNKEKFGDTNGEKVIMDKALQQANHALAAHNRYVEREIHEVTHAIMYKIKDSTTGEVLFEFPPKKLQDMIAKMWENAGIFIDKEG